MQEEEIISLTLTKDVSRCATELEGLLEAMLRI